MITFTAWREDSSGDGYYGKLRLMDVARYRMAKAGFPYGGHAYGAYHRAAGNVKGGSNVICTSS